MGLRARMVGWSGAAILHTRSSKARIVAPVHFCNKMVGILVSMHKTWELNLHKVAHIFVGYKGAEFNEFAGK